VAINGTNFCKSACDAVATLLSNPLRVIAINSVGLFVLFLGKYIVSHMLSHRFYFNLVLLLFSIYFHENI